MSEVQSAAAMLEHCKIMGEVGETWTQIKVETLRDLAAECERLRAEIKEPEWHAMMTSLEDKNEALRAERDAALAELAALKGGRADTDDIFWREKLAIKFCEARGVNEGSKERASVVDAFVSALSFTAPPAQASAWVPVSERMPDEDVPVLCWCECDSLDADEGIVLILSQHNSFFTDDFHELYEPEYWQPLPATPTPGASDGKGQ